MSTKIAEEQLATDISIADAIQLAYAPELERSVDALRRQLPVLVECDKELTPYFYQCLRNRLKTHQLPCIYLDGRVRSREPSAPSGLIATIIRQLQDAVRGATDERVVVLPHLDLLTSSTGGLTSEAREVIPLLYENPAILWLGFKDPSFPVPRVIERLFVRRESILGVARDRLGKLVTQRESRKFGPDRHLDPQLLYRYVSGVNAARLRRVLARISGEDYPKQPRAAIEQLRNFTVGPELTVPEVDLRRDIGGYARVKRRLEREIVDILARQAQASSDDELRRIEALIPRGMIFWGPPGTGKTLFAKALASAFGAAVIVVNGPELKSRWVGESEHRLRQIFVQARKSAPSIIVFDELDSFASARGTYTGSGVEHSMVNQLLTEMDGFRREELVFVVGTTNLVEALDPALLRPGRFEFHLHIPYPDADDRREILRIHGAKLELAFDEAGLEHAVRRTADPVPGVEETRYSGDHLQALCRQIARNRLREGRTESTGVEQIEAALREYLQRPELTEAERWVVATHEAGHAMCALHCAHAPPIDRISIEGDLSGTLGFVQYGDPAHRYVVTRQQLLDSICVLHGGREAESLLLDDVSIGAAHDLDRATATARSLVERFGLGSAQLGVGRFDEREGGTRLSEAMRARIDDDVARILDEQRRRARKLLETHRGALEELRRLLIQETVLERETLAALTKPASA